MSAVIFLSAVSSEFHNRDPLNPQSFASYRDVLTRSLRLHIPGCTVVVQEELAQGFGDLLSTLDEEVRRSTFVIHLVGAATGAKPGAAELRRLGERHPDLLAHEPELTATLPDRSVVTYTQWEVYLAYQHARPRLVFLADPKAPRSPVFRPDRAQLASQREHVRRIRATDQHTQPCHTQSDWAVKAVVAIERQGLNPTQPTAPADPAAVDAARRDADTLVAEIATGLRNAARTAIQDYDPAGIDAYLRVIDEVARRRNLTRRAVLTLVGEIRDTRKRAADTAPTPTSLHEFAFAELALGNHYDAMVLVRQQVEIELQLLSQDQTHHDEHQDRVLSGHLLWADAARYAGLRDEALRALESGVRYIDRDRDPVLWADFAEGIAEHLLTHAQLDRAEGLIDQVLEVREEHQPESRELADSLLVWCLLLFRKANDAGLLAVARRAEHLFSTPPPDPVGLLSSWNNQALAFQRLGRFTEAEPLFRRALTLGETTHDPDHPVVATALNNLAQLLKDDERFAEAEPHYRRALAIDEVAYGRDHPTVAIDLNNLAVVLKRTTRFAEAEEHFRRAMAINEATYGEHHPEVATVLNNLAGLLDETDRPVEAERLLRRALVIHEVTFGPDHPDLAIPLNNLAGLLALTGQFAEAELLVRRSLDILTQCYGEDHPRTRIALENYSALLEVLGR